MNLKYPKINEGPVHHLGFTKLSGGECPFPAGKAATSRPSGNPGGATVKVPSLFVRNTCTKVLHSPCVLQQFWRFQLGSGTRANYDNLWFLGIAEASRPHRATKCFSVTCLAASRPLWSRSQKEQVRYADHMWCLPLSPVLDQCLLLERFFCRYIDWARDTISSIRLLFPFRHTAG